MFNSALVAIVGARSFLIALAFLLMVVVPAIVGTRSAWDGEKKVRRKRKWLYAAKSAAALSAANAVDLPRTLQPAWAAQVHADNADELAAAVYAAGTTVKDQQEVAEPFMAAEDATIHSRPVLIQAADTPWQMENPSQAITATEPSADEHRFSAAETCMPAFAYIQVPAAAPQPEPEQQQTFVRPNWHETIVSEPSPVPYLVRQIVRSLKREPQPPVEAPAAEAQSVFAAAMQMVPMQMPASSPAPMAMPQFVPVPYFVPAPYGYPYMSQPGYMPAQPYAPMLYPPQFMAQQQWPAAMPYPFPPGMAHPQVPFPQHPAASAYMAGQQWPIVAPQWVPAAGQPQPVPPGAVQYPPQPVANEEETSARPRQRFATQGGRRSGRG